MNDKKLVKTLSVDFNNKNFLAIIEQAVFLGTSENIDILNLVCLAFDQQAIIEKNINKRNELWSESIKYATLIQDKFPKSSKGYSSMGLVYQHQGKTLEAINLYKKARKINPSNHSLLLSLGNGYRANKDYSLAEKYYIKATKYKNSKELASVNLVGLYEEMKKEI